VKKYPVYSDSGEQYMVSVKKCEHEVFRIFVYTKRTGWLSKIFKWERLESGSCEGRYSPLRWGYGIVEMVKNEVNNCEKSIEEKKIHNWQIKQISKDFENWNGK
jgi:hypothetical protein